MPDKIIEGSNVEIGADISSLQAALAQAIGDIKAFNESVVSVSRQLTTFNKEVSGDSVRDFSDSLREANKPLRDLSLGMGVLATAGIAAGAAITSTFAEFEQQVANIQAVSGATKSEIKEISDIAREFGTTTVFSAAQATEGMTELAKAGFNVQQTVSASSGALALAAATNENFGTVTDVLVGALNQFNLTATDSSRVANLYAAAIARSQATTDRLRDSMKFIGSIANSVNVPIEQVTAALSLLFNAGFQASTAGTALRQVFLRLQAPTRGAREALTSLGLAASAVNPQARDLVEILDAFKKVGADAKDKGDELAKVFGDRAVSAFQVLIRQGAPALAALQAQITGTNEATKQAAIQIDTFKGSFRLLIAQLQETAIQFGTVLVPILRSVVDVLRDVLAAFNELPSGFKTAIVVVGGLATALLTLGTPITFLVAQIPYLIDGFVKLRVILGGALPVIGGVTLAITALAAGLLYLLDSQRKSREESKNAIKNIEGQIEARGREVERVNSLASAYVRLADSGVDTEEEQKALAKVSGDLNAIYPGLISNTNTYAQNLDNVKRAAAESAVEMGKLLQEKRRFEEIKATFELTDLQKSLREARKELSEVDQSLSEIVNNTVPLKNDTKEFLNSLTLANNAAAITEKVISQVGDKASILDLGKLEEGLRASVKESKNVLPFFGEIANISEAIRKNETRITEIQQGRATLGEAEFRRMFRVNDLGKNEEDTLKRRNSSLESVLGVYTKIAGQLKDVEELNINILDAERKLEAIKKSEAQTTFTPTGNVQDFELPEPDPGKDDEKAAKKEEQRLEKLADFARDIEKKRLDNAVRFAKAAEADTTDLRLAAIENEFQARKQVLEAEKNEDLRQLDEIGDSRLTKVREQAQKELQARLLAAEGVRRQAIGESTDGGQVEIIEAQFAGELEAAQKAHDQKVALAEKESADKISVERAYGEELQTLTLQRNNDIAEEISKASEAEAERALVKLEHEYETEQISLEQYRASLMEKLNEAVLWSDQYIQILKKIDDIEQKMNNDRDKRAKVTAQNIVKTFDIIGNAFERSSNGMTNAWKDALKDVVDMFANHYVRILEMDLAKALALQNFPQAVRDTAAIAGIKVAATLAKQAIERAAVGAHIRSEGVIQVHRGEQIVPASIVRSTKQSMQAIQMNNEIANRSTARVPMTTSATAGSFVIERLEINNPIVGDQEYWNRVVENHIGEAFFKLEEQRRSRP